MALAGSMEVDLDLEPRHNRKLRREQAALERVGDRLRDLLRSPTRADDRCEHQHRDARDAHEHLREKQPVVWRSSRVRSQAVHG